MKTETLNSEQVLEQAAGILGEQPFGWRVTVEYPGFLLIVIDERHYAAGFANPTLTVDATDHEGNFIDGVDTHVACVELDGYRMAIHIAAAIDRMEHA